MSVDIVVAKFREDISWVQTLKKANPSYTIMVYDKSGEPLQDYEFCKVSALPNLGREAETILHHIVEHWDSLADNTLFCQGHPFDHLRTPKDEYIEAIAKDIQNALDEKHYVIFTCNDFGAPHHCGLPVRKAYLLMDTGTPPPSEYRFVAGAQFLVKKEHIKHRPIDFYKQLLERVRKNEICPWTMERLWAYIFS